MRRIADGRELLQRMGPDASHGNLRRSPPGPPAMSCNAARRTFALVLAASCLMITGCCEIPRHKAGITDLPVVTEKRLQLTGDYCRVHYGLDGYTLKDPRMIVVHYTAAPTLQESYEFFRPSELQAVRTDIRSGGELNVTAHYLVDKDGAIYRLAPENVVCRHTIGFNHVALGIENVGADSDDLTEAQIAADAMLIHDLATRYPTLEYLIGHHEYMDASLPHFTLFRELDPGYRPTVKIDPGPAFMKRLRSVLLENYGIRLKE